MMKTTLSKPNLKHHIVTKNHVAITTRCVSSIWDNYTGPSSLMYVCVSMRIKMHAYITYS